MTGWDRRKGFYMEIMHALVGDDNQNKPTPKCEANSTECNRSESEWLIYLCIFRFPLYKIKCLLTIHQESIFISTQKYEYNHSISNILKIFMNIIYSPKICS